MMQHQATSALEIPINKAILEESEASWGDMGEHNLLTHNLKAAGSNPAPATTKHMIYNNT
jgi:hypothetical protein